MADLYKLGDKVLASVKQGLQISPPRLKYEWIDLATEDGADLAADKYENRTITLPLKVSGATTDALIAEVNAIIAEAIKDTNVLEFKPHGATDSIYFDTFKADVDIPYDWVKTPHGVMEMTLIIPAKPKGSGDEVTTKINYVIDGALDRDDDNDGVANSWADDDSGTITVAKSIDNSEAQKIDVTGGSTIGYTGIKQEMKLAPSVGEDSSARIEVKTTAANLSVDQEQTSSGSFSDKTIKGDDYAAQTFQAGYGGPIVKVDVYIGKTGSPANLIMELKNVVAGDPGSTIYATEEIDAGDIGGPGIHSFTFTSPYLGIASTDYAIVLRQKDDGGSGSDYYVLWGHNADDYANGAYKYTENGGSSWSTHLTVDDLYFKIYIPDVHYDVFIEFTGSGIDVRLLLNEYLTISSYTEKYYLDLPVPESTTNIWFHARVVVNKAAGTGTLYVKKAGFYNDTVLPTTWYESRFKANGQEIMFYGIPGDVDPISKIYVKNIKSGDTIGSCKIGLKSGTTSNLENQNFFIEAEDMTVENGSIETDTLARNHQRVTHSPVTSWIDVVSLTIDSTNYSRLKGRYQLFIVARSTHSSEYYHRLRYLFRTIANNDIEAGIEVQYADGISVGNWRIMDLGEIQIPIGVDFSDHTQTVKLIIQDKATAAEDDWYLDYIILLPTDEALGLLSGQSLSYQHSLFIDGSIAAAAEYDFENDAIIQSLDPYLVGNRMGYLKTGSNKLVVFFTGFNAEVSAKYKPQFLLCR